MTAARKRTYLALIAVGGVALAVDRLLPPASSQAGTATLVESARKEPSPAESQAANAAAALAVPELPFPRGLPDWDPNEPIRDLFSPVDTDEYSTKHAGREALGQVAGFGTCAHLTENSRLDAILVNDRVQIAVISGQRMSVGGERLGCKLFSVEGGLVRFHCKDGEAVITLKPSGTNP